jgi:hypothetical protein
MSGGLNDSPRFIQALGQIVHEALEHASNNLITIRSTERTLAAPQYATAAGLD